MLHDRTTCFKAVAEHNAGGSKAAAMGKEAVFSYSLTSVNNRAATEKRDSFLHVSAKILPNWPLGSCPKARFGFSKASFACEHVFSKV